MRKALLAVAAASITLSAALLAPGAAAGITASPHTNTTQGMMQPDPWWSGG